MMIAGSRKLLLSLLACIMCFLSIGCTIAAKRRLVLINDRDVSIRVVVSNPYESHDVAPKSRFEIRGRLKKDTIVRIEEADGGCSQATFSGVVWNPTWWINRSESKLPDGQKIWIAKIRKHEIVLDAVGVSGIEYELPSAAHVILKTISCNYKPEETKCILLGDGTRPMQ